MYETLLIDGTNLATVANCITSLDGLYSVGPVRGNNLVFPGVDGETWLDRPFDVNTINLGIVLEGDTTTKFNDAYRVLKLLIPPGKQVALTRRLSYTAGNEENVALGEYAGGLAPTLSLMRFGTTTLSIKIHGGLWYAASATTATAGTGSTITAPGETRTHRMTITMPTGGFLTNTTTNHTVSNTATGGSGTVIIDVEDMSATLDGNDVSNTLLWDRAFPMRLVPGVNTFIGSTCTVVYTPAYF